MGNKSSTVVPEDSKAGKPYEKDENFNGPINEGRKCRDVLCLLLFVVFWGVWILEMILVVTDGCPDNCNTPLRLVYGYDSNGNMCGGKGNESQKRMFIGLPIKLSTTRVCVDVCPTTTGALLCVDSSGKQTAAPTGLDLLKMQDCYTAASTVSCCYLTYPTKEVLFKCVPNLGSDSTSFNSTTMGTVDQYNAAVSFAANPAGAAGAAIGKLVQYWVVIAASCLVALILGFIWLIFLRLFVGIMVWTTVVGILFVLIVLTVFAWEKAGTLDLAKANVYTNSVGVTLSNSSYVAGVDVDPTTAKVLASIISCVTIVYFLLFCVFMQRIRIAVQIIKEAAKAIGAMPFLVLYPLVTYISLLALGIWWVAVLLYLCSAGEFDTKTMSFTYPDTSSCVTKLIAANGLISEYDATALCKIYKSNSETALVAYNSGERATIVGNTTALGITNKYKSQLPIQLNGSTYKFFVLYHLFGGLWTYAMVIGVSYMVVAGSVASWYWAIDKKKLGRFPVLASLKRTIRYHLGSVAFGAFILAVVRFIQIVFNYMMNRMKRAKDHPVVKILICIINCCLKCLERFINFLNKNAYIMIAIHGKAFCPSAKDAFLLLIRNALRVVAVNVIGDFMLLLGKIFVSLGTILAAWAYFQAIKSDPTLLPAAFRPGGAIDSSTPIFPLLLVAVLGFGIGCAFMGIFETAIDCIFLSFCEDCERNKESSPYMPDSLRKIVGIKKPKEDVEDGGKTVGTDVS